MTQSIRQICAVAPLPVDPAAEWIEIMPIGEFRLADHRGKKPLRFDPASAPSVIAASFAAATGGELMIDFDHRSLADQKLADTRAAGWIKAMKVEGERVLASVSWTPEGRAALEGRSYRFLSPVFRNLLDGRVTLIESAALVNDPALPQLRQLASKETLMEPMEEIAGLLGIAADKPADIVARVTVLAAAETQLASIQAAAKVTGDDATRQICARLSSPAVDPTQFVSVEAFNEVQTQLASLQKDVGDKRVEDALEAGRAAGKITPANEAWFRQLASKDMSLFDTGIAQAPVLVNLGDRQLAGKTPPKPSADKLTDEERTVASKLGLTSEAMLATRAAETKEG